MIPFGTLFNVATVLIGSTIGLLFKKMISPELNKKVFFVNYFGRACESL